VVLVAGNPKIWIKMFSGTYIKTSPPFKNAPLLAVPPTVEKLF
jgi:hypothetical protein